MNEQVTEIVPAEITEIKHVKYFNVIVTNLELFTSVSLVVQFLDEHKRMVQSNSLTLTGTEYTNWSNNDNYIIDYVASTYGFIIK
jgi:hypothetical protein